MNTYFVSVIVVILWLGFFQGSGIIKVNKAGRENIAMAENKYAEAYKLFDKGKNAEAVGLFEEASALYLITEDWNSCLLSLINAGKCYRNMQQYNIAEKVFMKAENLAREKLDSNDLIFSTLYGAEAYMYTAKAEYDRSIELAKKSISIRQKKNRVNDTLLLFPYYSLGMNYFYKGDYVLSEKNYLMALGYIMLCENKSTVELASCWNSLGQVLWMQGNFDNAMKCYDKAQSIYNKLLTTDIELPDFAYNNITIASFYTQLGRYKESLDFLFKAEIYIKNKYSSLSSLLGIIYTYNALNYLKIYDYKRAITESKKAICLLEKDSTTNIMYTGYNYYYQGSGYSGLNKVNEAITCYLKCISLKQKSNKANDPNSFLLLARCYEKTNQIKKSDSTYKAIIDILEKNNERLPILASIFLNYGNFCYNNNIHEKAFYCYSEALDICLDKYGYHSTNTANVYNEFAKLFAKQEKYDKALQYFQLALASQIKSVDSSNIYANPPAKEISGEINLLITLKGKGKAFYKKYISDSSKTEYLRASLQSYEPAINTIDKLKILYSNSESAAALLENENETFDEAVEVASELYQLSDSERYFNIAFMFAEKSKSSSLLAAIRNNDALIGGKVPVAFREFEKNIQQQIEQYKKLIYEESKTAATSSKKIVYLNSKLTELNTNNDLMVQYLEKTYPEYYNLKYNTDVISADSIAARLPDGEAFIEYTVTGKNLISFFINGKTRKINVYPIDSTFTEAVEKYTGSINNSSDNDSNAFEQFVKSASFLYKYLLKPIDNLCSEKKLIIVPDEILYNAPFESLLYADVNNGTYGYKELPYLIKRNAVSYAASGTLLFEKNNISKNAKNTLLAFVPTYENVSSGNLNEGS
ncbi:MAG: tetratricopeptide repeat protein, partial [Bacteroidota bacterium]